MKLIYHGAGMMLYHTDPKTKITSVLLGKRLFNPDKGCWSIPGGGWEQKKDGYYNGHPNYWATAQREMGEELRLRIKKNSQGKIFRIWKLHSIVFSFEVFAFKCKNRIIPPVGTEFSEMRWFNIDHLPKNYLEKFVPQQIEELRKYL